MKQKIPQDYQIKEPLEADRYLINGELKDGLEK